MVEEVNGVGEEGGVGGILDFLDFFLLKGVFASSSRHDCFDDDGDDGDDDAGEWQTPKRI